MCTDKPVLNRTAGVVMTCIYFQLFNIQQVGLVPLPASVTSCSTADNQTPPQTSVTMDMNTVSSV